MFLSSLVLVCKLLIWFILRLHRQLQQHPPLHLHIAQHAPSQPNPLWVSLHVHLRPILHRTPHPLRQRNLHVTDTFHGPPSSPMSHSVACLRTGPDRDVDAEPARSGSKGVVQKTLMDAQDGAKKVHVSNKLMDARDRQRMTDGTMLFYTLVADGALPAGHLHDFLRLTPWNSTSAQRQATRLAGTYDLTAALFLHDEEQ